MKIIMDSRSRRTAKGKQGDHQSAANTGRNYSSGESLEPGKDQFPRQDLSQLLPLWPHECRVTEKTDRDALLRHLRRSLRAERRRGIAGHWSYDLTRHANLLQAYRTELSRERGDPL